MSFRELLPTGSVRTFGEPVTTQNGAMVIPVTEQRRGQTDGHALGVFVVHDGRAKWCPVINSDRVALIGALTGFAAATLGCLAVLRQPPWPKVTLHR